MGAPDRPQDSYRYGPEEVAELGERTEMEPVPPATIRERLEAGEVLVTTDIPGYLSRPIASDVGAPIALYRLVQLFGTPNVPGLEAGADQPLRERTTWQYLFSFTVRPSDDADDPAGTAGDPERYLVSAYDLETNLSVGVSRWQPADADARRPGPEPSPEALPGGAMPADARLELIVKLVLSTVEHVVEATYEDLYV